MIISFILPELWASISTPFLNMSTLSVKIRSSRYITTEKRLLLPVIEKFYLNYSLIGVDIYCGATVGSDGGSIGNYQLTGLAADRENKRLFITSRSGRVFIYDISPVI